MLGGADLAASFMRLGLIDEFRVYVHPVILGAGTPMFAPSRVPVNLELAESRTFGNGVVLLRYDRAAD
jgi:dihydrofolate reductase